MVNTLRVEGLVKLYGKRRVVNSISFSMTSDEITGLLGPNGAGKTTTFYMIVGFIKANKGRIFLNEQDITPLPMYKRSQLGLSYLPQESSIFRKLSVEQNINLVLQSRKDINKAEKQKTLDSLIDDFGIGHIRKQPGYTLSGGERRRTEIARALASSPKFLLLDEPFAGIDPKAVYEIKNIIRHLHQKGIGILLTDHNVRDTLSITTCAHIINAGEILVSGDKATLLDNQMAKDIYFGSDFGEQ
ncbi:MAG: LPS export ABC transporter ATP-binding protein [Spirochaetales bacterium]|nr:LPS export ABC transporter ATP-binding protein [Spirochaetales bacterium]